MKHTPDIIKTKNTYVNMSSGIPHPDHASTGDWYYNNGTKQMTYIVTGGPGARVQDITLQVPYGRCSTSLLQVEIPGVRLLCTDLCISKLFIYHKLNTH